ncbi:P-loop NTPase family protein [Lacunimicrobium album]
MLVDQASVLRSRVRQQTAQTTSNRWTRAEVAPVEIKSPRTILVSSGKGGAGKSSVALNLGLSLAETGKRVMLVDASAGLSHLDLLCGLNAYWNLEHVITGSRFLNDVLLNVMENVDLITGLSSAIETGLRVPAQKAKLTSQLDRIASNVDYVVIDSSCGLSSLNRQLINAVDLAYIVTTLEATALADSYSMLKSLAGQPLETRIELVVNRSETSTAQAAYANLKQTMTMFLHRDMPLAGSIPEDVHVQKAVMSRYPLVISHPESPAAQAIKQLTRRAVSLMGRQRDQGPFFRRLMS